MNYAHEVISNGGMECGNCGGWRIMQEREYDSPIIETCANCGDEAFELYSIEDEVP